MHATRPKVYRVRLDDNANLCPDTAILQAIPDPLRIQKTCKLSFAACRQPPITLITIANPHRLQYLLWSLNSNVNKLSRQFRHVTRSNKFDDLLQQCMLNFSNGFGKFKSKFVATKSERKSESKTPLNIRPNRGGRQHSAVGKRSKSGRPTRDSKQAGRSSAAVQKQQWKNRHQQQQEECAVVGRQRR